MSTIEVMAIAFGVSLDAFAVSAAGALIDREHPPVHAAIAALFFGGFQFLMPLAGYGLGLLLRGTIASIDHYVAFALLLGVGGRMIYEAFQKDDGEKRRSPFAISSVCVLAVATSIDAAAVGASLSFIDVSIWFPAAAMGLVTAVVSGVGVFLGNRVGGRFNARIAATAGGAAIIMVGVKILVEHLLA